MKHRSQIIALLAIVMFVAGACATLLTKPSEEAQPAFSIDYEKYTLDNGLDVILHRDQSDPIVATMIRYHVGSNREKPGRTGFAHLFEHILFQESENVGQDEFFKNIQEAGGTLNGSTYSDGTNYYNTVPKNALEMVLWMESDRMGFLLGKVTQDAFANQQDVVMNEKRQGVDNVPYGHTSYILGKLLYPESHPYSWQVIGAFEDLQSATLEDVKEFFRTWYGPNNATLVIAGDFDRDQTIAWVEKYFGEINSGPPVADPESWNAKLDEIKRAFHEDNFANSPQLSMVYPTIGERHPDANALNILGDLLSSGKKSPLYKVIVEERKLAPSARASQRSLEITGSFSLRIGAFPNVNLTEVEKTIFESLERFETDGFTDSDLARIKAQTERGFYDGISGVLNKARMLADYNEYFGSPDYIGKDIQEYLDVTREDVMRVYNTYIKDKPYVLTSFVPKGQVNLVAEGSERFPIVEDPIIPDRIADEPPAEPGAETVVEKTPSSFDRSVMPPNGPDPLLTIPAVWKHTRANGVPILGIQNTEVPLIQFSLVLKGGQLLDSMDKLGVASLVANLMTEGTKNKTPIELEEAIDELGSSISVSAGRETMTIQARCLRRNFAPTYALVEEILLEPRWDETEFTRIKEQRLESIRRASINPTSISSNTFNKLLYGENSILGNPTSGHIETVERITIDDLKTYYQSSFSPDVAYIVIVGDITKEEAVETFKSLETKWQPKEVVFPEQPELPAIDRSRVYFVDVPGAKQSQIRVGCLALPFTHPDYFATTVMNYKLGGSFNSILNIILREEKGFTYGARSSFSGGSYPGTFAASSSVHSAATLESMQIVRDEMIKYTQGIPLEDLQFTKDALIKSNARRFETLSALRGMLDQIARYGLPDDYINDQERIVQDMTLAKHQQLAQQYLPADRMVYLVVGDAATQLESLKELGLGDPILLEND
ncbi:M16 family metallopeptidase [Candidatus Neomarinimicrobiota bacterium]